MKKLILLAAMFAASPVAADVTPELRKQCTDAMNTDKAFAASLVKVADEQAAIKRDESIVAAHKQAADDIAINEKHVIMSYAAMWLLSVIFVIFLWRKQGSLKLEIATLKRDLEAATVADPKVKA